MRIIWARLASSLVVGLIVIFQFCKPPTPKVFCSIGSEEFNTPLATIGKTFEDRGGVAPLHEGRGNGVIPQVFSEGACVFGPATRPLTEREIAVIENATGKKPIALPVASEALVVVSSQTNITPSTASISSITIEDLSTLFTKSTLNGKEVSIYGFNSASDRYRFFKESALKGKDYSDRIHELDSPKLVISSLSSQSGFSYLRPAELVPALKSIPINVNGRIILPDERSVQSGEYPISRYWYIYFLPQSLGKNEKSFLDFLLSSEIQNKLKLYGLYALSELDRNKSLRTIAENAR